MGAWLPDHRPLPAVGLITPHTGLVPVQQQHRAVSDTGRRAHHGVISFVRLSTPKCAFLRRRRFAVAEHVQQRDSGLEIVEIRREPGETERIARIDRRESGECRFNEAADPASSPWNELAG
jgi:hypothetical protein